MKKLKLETTARKTTNKLKNVKQITPKKPKTLKSRSRKQKEIKQEVVADLSKVGLLSRVNSCIQNLIAKLNQLL